MNIEEKISFWMKLSDMDIPVMNHLFDSGDYHYALYIGHLSLEKILKANFVKNNQTVPPKIHSLNKLAQKSNIKLSKEQEKFLLLVDNFNIEARYPDEKFNFYKLCTREYTIEKLEEIEEFQKWLKSLLK